jgi:Tol biopolymer transport system component
VYGVGTGLFVFNRPANTTAQIGPALIGSHLGLRFSGESRFLAYSQPFSNTNQVYVYDFLSGTNVLISQGTGLGTPSGVSDSPEISADGRFVAYRSLATNLVATADNNLVPDLFLYDQWSSNTTLLTRSRYGATTGDNRAATPIFSPDGRTLVFSAARKPPTWYRLISIKPETCLLSLSFMPPSIPAALAGVRYSLGLPGQAKTTRSYTKTILGDATWQTATGSVTITGNQAQLTDLAPAAGHRFYRIVAY